MTHNSIAPFFAVALALLAPLSAAAAPPANSDTPNWTFSGKRQTKKLIKATIAEDHAKIEELLAGGADINLPVKIKKMWITPLERCFWSRSSCKLSTIKLLIDNGADERRLTYDKEKKRWKPKTALNEAIRLGRLDVMDYLMTRKGAVELDEETHEKLYKCYANGCTQFGGKKDAKKARYHLERAVAKIGDRPYNTNYNQDPRWRLAYDISNAMSTWLGRSYYKELVKVWTKAEAVAYCDRALEWFLPAARRENDRICRKAQPLEYCTDNSGIYPNSGTAYSSIRSLLDGCLAFTQSEADWDRYFAKRLEYYSLRVDPLVYNNWVLQQAIARYKKRGDIANANKYRGMGYTTVSQARRLKQSHWEPSRKAEVARARAWLANKAQEKREREKYAAQRRRQRRAQEAEDRRWSKQQDAQWAAEWTQRATRGDAFDNKLARIEKQAMNNIERSRVRQAAPVKPAPAPKRRVTYAPKKPVKFVAKDPFAAQRTGCLARGLKWIGNRCDSPVNKVTFPGRACADKTGEACKTGETVDYDAKTGKYVARKAAASTRGAGNASVGVPVKTSGKVDISRISCATPYAFSVPDVHGFSILQGGSVAAGGPYCEHFSPRRGESGCDGHKSRHAGDFELRGNKHCAELLGGKKYVGTTFTECNCGVNDAGNPQCRIAYKHACR